jgi:hypothetical protein
MPAVLTKTSVVFCAHGGNCTSVVGAPRLRILGQPVVTAGTPWIVAGCPMVGPNNVPLPCTTVNFVSFSVRVKTNGQPLLLQSSVGIAQPTGAPVRVVTVQPRVQAR